MSPLLSKLPPKVQWQKIGSSLEKLFNGGQQRPPLISGGPKLPLISVKNQNKKNSYSGGHATKNIF